ncbi:Ilm1p KNAG_0D05180 [Huiozyma naganishii CBS 8797]|uniref:Protein ILM1 n=1 Tax=Huiozyma naganishii (strain ATCC MYA-139 / BCRC 22969 / CBS 8797 / KCTC 17520 / NBRC 10181 / NCYC 3082 / Yp74L-3) TaxID=1071383 RepID=J7S7D1_HUIN7|nr:hypothetical protein KNAG_0D05180 [Kazachstania naganishii CBS 8797]CCK70256.1 hypothetical protein KNAG_0D05180 [Kazachstania naganishii CBS 8797]
MGVLSSVNVLFVRIAFLFTLSYLVLKDVNIILENSYLEILSQSMNLPAIAMNKYSAQLGMVSMLFVTLALGDLVPLLEDNKMYFGSAVPVRLLIFFVVTGLSYIWEGNLYIHNNVVFAYSFVEVWLNFIIYNSLREEKMETFKAKSQVMAASELLDEDDVVAAAAD